MFVYECVNMHVCVCLQMHVSMCVMHVIKYSFLFVGV